MDEIHAANTEKRWVALSSVIAALLLTGTKLLVGVLSGSIGILAEAAHSGLDMLAAAVTYLAVRASSKPADREHAYGHGKVENLSALFETFLLFVTCIWIVYEAGKRLLGYEEVHVVASGWTFGVIILSIAVDVTRSRALMKVAKKHNSQALEADALHFSTDIWSSCVVLIGLGCVWLSGRLGLPWLQKADSIAALGVAVIVVGVCIRLGRKSVDDLIDTVPQDFQDKLRMIAKKSPGVVDVSRVRVRRSGPDLFADVTIVMICGTGLEAGHFAADELERGAKAAYPRIDVVVHVEPEPPPK